jgi:2-oxoglutarate ferredoxin oxidoreductase subunit beta
MTTGLQEPPKPLTKADFASDQEVRWCPGCGDYAILNSFLTICPSLGIPREKLVIISGIGCAARFPYYVNSYGIHSIHGRAPAVATGVKLANPDLMVWVVGGDGDMLSIGGNHLMHALRRNVDLKIICINNRIYGLTKGQYSPTSEFGKKTKSTPLGSVDSPVNPLSLALAAEATFVARSVDIYQKHLQDILLRAAKHKGSVFVEVLQNCLIFNDGAFKDQTDRELRDDRQISLEHGKPLIFGKEKDKGIRLKGTALEVVNLKDVKPEELMVHDEAAAGQVPAYMLTRMDHPVPIGVFRAVEKPAYDRMVQNQIAEARKARGKGDLHKLLRSGDIWEVPAKS